MASGSPRRDGFVLWTRLAPRPLEGGGLDPVAIDVAWEVAEDERFRRIVARGLRQASPERAHAVHVECSGLRAGREYHYRFHAGGETSPAGRTRTAPPAGSLGRLRLAFGSCQHYEQGWFVAHRHLAAEEADLVVFLGDYIYESSWGREPVRRHGSAEPLTIEGYRDRYALYKGDADLQSAHACAPWLVTWDDHEVDNDYAGERSESLDPAFGERRAAAYRAFFEHMPLRPSALLADGGYRIHDRLDWGALATIHLLDDRQHRSPQACPRAGRGGGNVVGAECAERLAAERTMLGAEQERWLDAGLAGSRGRWNVIAQQTLFSPATRPGREGPAHWTDGWDGYPAARERLLESLRRHRPRNPVVIGGDVHATYVCDVHERPAQPRSPVIATEFCGTSITSQGPSARQADAIRAANPHILHADALTRGYVTLEMDGDALEARLRGVATVKRPDAGIATVAQWRVEDGRAGVVRP